MYNIQTITQLTYRIEINPKPWFMVYAVASPMNC